MFFHPLQARSQLGIRLQQPPDQVLTAFARETVVELAIMIVADPSVSLFECGRVEGWLPYQQGVQYTAQRPNIRLIAVRLLVQHFRSDVVRRATYRPADTNATTYYDVRRCR